MALNTPRQDVAALIMVTRGRVAVNAPDDGGKRSRPQNRGAAEMTRLLCWLLGHDYTILSQLHGSYCARCKRWVR
jgi:hypothetical protein